MNPYREPAPTPPKEPEPIGPCTSCHRGHGIRSGFRIKVSGTYGAGDEVYRFVCKECGDEWL